MYGVFNGVFMCLDKSDIDSVLELMITHWNMYEPKEPNLVITVIGGAKNFRLDGKKKEIFNRGLIEVNYSVQFVFFLLYCSCLTNAQ